MFEITINGKPVEPENFEHAIIESAVEIAKEIALQAEEGDETAKASIQRYAERLAKSLASIINVIDPDDPGNVLVDYPRVAFRHADSGYEEE